MDARVPMVEMKDISIAFGGVKAVDHAYIDLYPGEVVGLLGHNGAGKSCLIKILSGAYKRDAGQILINGQEAKIDNPRDAKHYGIETVYQALALADNVDAASNLYLGRELLTRWGTLDDASMEAEARKVMGRLNPAASGNRSPLPARSISTPKSSSWTSRPPRWGLQRRRRSANWSSSSKPKESEFFLSATTFTTSSTSPTGLP
jgi:D-xylose transport system ATP-binding protein